MYVRIYSILCILTFSLSFLADGMLKGAITLPPCTRSVKCNILNTIVCLRSVGRNLRAEVYVIVECSYFAYTSQLTVCP